MTARQLRTALQRLRLSQRGLARQLQVDPRTVRHWAVGNHRIPHAVALLLRTWTEVPRLIPQLPRQRRTR